MRGLKLEGGFVKRLRSTPTAIVHGAPSERSTSVRACSFANAVNSCCKLTEAIGIASRQNMRAGMRRVGQLKASEKQQGKRN
jgi:hypothetical protein